MNEAERVIDQAEHELCEHCGHPTDGQGHAAYCQTEDHTRHPHKPVSNWHDHGDERDWWLIW